MTLGERAAKGPVGRVLHRLDTRSTFERRALRLAAGRMRRLPRGSGRPVIVVPGHGCGDRESEPLRQILTDLGHDARGWGLGVNDDRDGLLDELSAVVDAVGEPVALVGLSLGGVFARELARRVPDQVRFVATLGSPLQHGFGRTPDRELPIPPVPTLCVVARFDQYVPAADATVIGDPGAEVVRVVGGHCGLASNPKVISLLAHRLADRPAEDSG